jgi:hypothetical protein
MRGQTKKALPLLSARKWLELAAEVRGLADAAQSPEVRSALRELSFNYTAFAAGLDASNSGAVVGADRRRYVTR